MSINTVEAVPHEHFAKSTEVEVEYFPDHEPRTESSVFRRTKQQGHSAGLRCAVSGRPNPEYHHLAIEWAFSSAVCWATVKRVATGDLTELPVLDPITDLPTSETFPADQSLIWMICKLAEARGFDWSAFEPEKPEAFVDSMVNMLPLDAKFHRSPTHGIHHRTLPTWMFQCFPRVKDFVFTPDEA